MNRVGAKRVLAIGLLTILVTGAAACDYSRIVTVILIGIATAMIVTQTGTTMGAMTGSETGIGEIAIAAIGTVIDSGSSATSECPAGCFECDYSALNLLTGT
jgi:hypothetical protein